MILSATRVYSCTTPSGSDFWGDPVHLSKSQAQRKAGQWTTLCAGKHQKLRFALLGVKCVECHRSKSDDMFKCPDCSRWLHFMCGGVTSPGVCCVCVPKSKRQKQPNPKHNKRDQVLPTVPNPAECDSHAPALVDTMLLALKHALGLETQKHIVKVATLKQQVSALTSPITASELKGPMGVVKAIAAGGGKHSEPLLRAILLEHRGAPPLVGHIGLQLPMVLKGCPQKSFVSQSLPFHLACGL